MVAVERTSGPDVGNKIRREAVRRRPGQMGRWRPKPAETIWHEAEPSHRENSIERFGVLVLRRTQCFP